LVIFVVYPLNWGDDFFEHFYLQHKFCNRLVEIERDNRSSKYRAIVVLANPIATLVSRKLCPQISSTWGTTENITFD